MRTSIKSRLFLLTYAIILFFIVGLIVLNSVFLDDYFVGRRKESLMSAFHETKALDIHDEASRDALTDIENSHNLQITVVRQLEIEDIPFGYDLDNLPDFYERVYGTRSVLRDEVIIQLILDFQRYFEGELDFEDQIVHINDDRYVGMTKDITSSFDHNDNLRMLSLTVVDTEPDLMVFYVFTVTFESIDENIAIFNSFTIIIGFVLMIVGGFVMYFISYRFTNPITQMTKTAQSIANLNFDRKVKVDTDDEIGELGESINRMSAQLEAYISELKDANEKLAEDIANKDKIDEMRKGFIASVSHELKTPLSLIMGYAEALNLDGLSEEAKTEYIDTIIDETNKMNRLVMKLLKISQLESGFEDITLKKTSLFEVLTPIMKSFEILFEEKGVDVSIDIHSPEVLADKDALRTILENYMQNALQHVSGEKRIEIYTQKRPEGKIAIIVHNTGPHIPKDEIDRIWDSFYKVDKARTRAYGGQGLGLHIVKMQAGAMHAGYGCENVEGGVNFYVILDKA